jgi:hypothetical protein
MQKFNRVIILCSMFFLSFVPISGPSYTEFQVAPNLIILGETGSVLGSEFTVNVTVSDAADLYGLDITLSWNTTYLNYVSHTPKIPVETYPDGVLHEPTLFVENDVDTSAGTYQLAVATLLPGEPFNGDGTVFEITFMVIDQPSSDEVPPPPNNYVSLPLQLYEPTQHITLDGEVRLYSLPPDYPPYPLVKVVPEVIGDKRMHETFPLDVWLMGEGGLDLGPFFDVSGAEIYLNFNSSLIEARSITIDPDGWFASFWSTSINEIIKEINNTAGVVRVAFNATDGLHTPVYGRGRLFNVEFKTVFESPEWPPPSCVLSLKNPPPRPVICSVETQVYVEGYQHPEREVCPWNSSDSRVPLPHFVENATYLVRFEPGISVLIHSPAAKNYSRQTLWLNVTANVPVENWYYSINSGSNVSFMANTTINVTQGENNLTIYASSLGMTGFSSVQFYALTGDVDEDRDVDIYDVVKITSIYYAQIGDPEYNRNSDIDENGIIDIYDVVKCTSNYGVGW